MTSYRRGETNSDGVTRHAPSVQRPTDTERA